MAMRIFFSAFFVSGLFFIGYSVYERREATSRGEVVAPVMTNEDGTGFPHPYPTPRPKLTR
jgi:hypothetical protein